jgi:hypothetical protein
LPLNQSNKVKREEVKDKGDPMDAPTQVAQLPKKEFSYDDATQILDMRAPLPKKQNDFQLPLPRTNPQKLLN